MFPVRRIFLSTLALAIAPAALVAQRPPLPVPPLPVPVAPAAAAGGTPATRGPGPLDGRDMVRVQFPNAQIADVLGYYQDWTGKHVVADNNVNGPINIVINESIPRTEAIKIIETQLTLNGFAIVPAGEIIKIIGPGKQARVYGVPLLSDVSLIPDTEQTISFLLRLRYLDAQELSTQLAQYLGQGNGNAGFVPLPKSGAVIITETASSVRRLISLITQLDVPASPVTEEFIRLERADATKAVEFLNGVFETKTSGSAAGGGAPGPGAANPAGGRRTIRRIGEDGQPVTDPVSQVTLPGTAGLLALNGDSIIQGRITLTADVRTNRIHVVTNPVNIPIVEKLIAEYDANTPFASPVRRNLRFVNARDVLPILIQALSEPGQDNNGNGSTGGSTSQPTQNRSTQNTSGSNGNSIFGNSSSSGGSGGGSFGSGSGSDLGGGEELNTQSVDTTPSEATVGTTKIIADPRSNTIILLGSAEARDKVFKVLDQLDVRAPQVVIRVVIGELSLSNDREFGANYLLSRSRGSLASNYANNTVFPGTTTTPSSTPAAGATPDPTSTGVTSTISTLSSLASGLPNGFTGGIAGIISVTKGFDIILSALEATNRFKTVNRPVLFTSNNKKATIISGQQVAVPTSSLSTSNTTGVNGASVASNVEFKTVALQLEVVPLINSDREVTLDIVQKLNSIVAGAAVTVGGNQIPTIAEREIKSTISMPNGATAVLGGLITMSDQRTNGEIPYLGRIPIIGQLFATRSKNISRSELVILLHPEVTNTPTELIEQRREEDRHNYLEHDLDEQLTPIIPRAKPVTQTTATVTARKKTTTYPK